MAEIVNLRQARKTRQRADKERIAATNRAKFGRTKAEKLAALAERARTERRLDGAKRDDD